MVGFVFVLIWIHHFKLTFGVLGNAETIEKTQLKIEETNYTVSIPIYFVTTITMKQKHDLKLEVISHTLL